MQCILKVFIQSIQKPIGKALMELAGNEQEDLQALSSRAHTHKKNKIVTNVKGHRLCRRVRVAAEVVLRLSTLKPDRLLKNCLRPMFCSWGREKEEKGQVYRL